MCVCVCVCMRVCACVAVHVNAIRLILSFCYAQKIQTVWTTLLEILHSNNAVKVSRMPLQLMGVVLRLEAT